MPQRTKPPFRADHVGSLLRPPELSAARDKWRQGELSAEALKEIEDKHIRDAVALQESAGIKAVTDGEFRRDYWHLDFIAAFDGIEINKETYGHAFSSGKTVPTFRTDGKFGNNNGYMREHFRYLNSITSETAKFCIPAPGMTYLRSGRSGVSEDAYPDLDEFWEDVIAAYANEVQALYDAGCRYLQFDDVSFAYLCDAEFRAGAVARGDDPDALVEIFATALSRAVANRPEDMTVTTHMCRGNFQSTWMAEGGYETVAEIMFEHLDVDGFFMEYDSERSGGFEPLRFVPDDKIVVAGLVTSKFPELEAKDEIIGRLEEAAKYVDMERLCLSPQCGFSSTHHGNNLTADDQSRKLALVVDIADQVWGTA